MLLLLQFPIFLIVEYMNILIFFFTLSFYGQAPAVSGGLILPGGRRLTEGSSPASQRAVTQ